LWPVIWYRRRIGLCCVIAWSADFEDRGEFGVERSGSGARCAAHLMRLRKPWTVFDLVPSALPLRLGSDDRERGIGILRAVCRTASSKRALDCIRLSGCGETSISAVIRSTVPLLTPAVDQPHGVGRHL